MTIDALIDAFVRKINRSPRHSIREEDIPRCLRAGSAKLGLYYDWTIQRFDRINWIAPIEAKLPERKIRLAQEIKKVDPVVSAMVRAGDISLVEGRKIVSLPAPARSCPTSPRLRRLCPGPVP